MPEKPCQLRRHSLKLLVHDIEQIGVEHTGLEAQGFNRCTQVALPGVVSAQRDKLFHGGMRQGS